jgi:hypothetical protein
MTIEAMPQRRVAAIQQRFEEQSHHRQRQRSDENPEHDTKIAGAELSRRDRSQTLLPQRGDVLSEIGNHRDKARQLHGGRECRPRIAPPQDPRDHPQMRRAADGQQLRDALDDTEHRHLQVGEFDESEIDAGNVIAGGIDVSGIVHGARIARPAPFCTEL